MNSSAEKHVRLTDSLPVHIVYFTVWVDEENGPSFFPDVYGHDRQQSAER
jgi:murein L,D-transpeptidase YcbB/YkuD